MGEGEKVLRSGMHGVKTARICALPTCRKEFEPEQEHQRFCSPEHRAKYYDLARQMGVAALEKMKEDYGERD